MSKTTKIVILVNVIASILLAIIISSTLYAWYVRTSHTESVDVTTNGIVLSYQIDEGDTNVETYSISDLVFFDIDSDYEGKYFTTMSHMIQIDITNKSKKNVDITLSYIDISSLTDPYVACVIADDDELDSLSSTGSVLEYISDNDLETTFTYLNVAKNQTKSFYVYIYGVQPDDDATNDFLYDATATTIKGETYEFELQIESVISEGQEADITQTEKQSSTETTTD